MAGPSFRIAILHYQPKGEAPDPVVAQVSEALTENGHSPVLVGVNESVADILTEMGQSQCDLVFNICETFAEDYRMEVNVAAFMELARLKHTGSGTTGLLLAQDKILTKQLLEYHAVLTPHFATFDGQTFETRGGMTFPLIVKPAKSDASIGIDLVKDWEELTKKVREIRREYDDDALAEEYIEGREIYVGVIGEPSRPEILPLVELDFGPLGTDVPRIANRAVKFGPEMANSPKLIVPTRESIPDDLRSRIERSALLAYRALKLRDYARIDFRISDQTNAAYLLEVNPNPYLDKAGELALAARQRGISYTQLIGRIVDSAAARYKLSKKTEAARAVAPPPPDFPPPPTPTSAPQ